MTKRFGFTLAEVLITLGIIGVVSAMTLPTLFSNYQSEALKTKKSLFINRLEEAMNQMRYHEKLTNYDSAEDFVDELEKYLKINERCSVDDLTDCFYDDFTDGEKNTVDVSTLLIGTNFASQTSTSDFGSDNVSVIFADGTKAIINYDRNCEWLDPYDGGASRSAAISCIAIIYDVNGSKGKNTMGSDVSSINGDFALCLDDGTCWDVSSTSNTCIDTCDGTSTYDPNFTSDVSSACTCNRWAGAIKACEDKNMSLPSMAQLAYMHNYLFDTDVITAYTQVDGLSLNTSRVYDLGFLIESSGTKYYQWSNEESSSNPDLNGYVRMFSTSMSYQGTGAIKSWHSVEARCVK
ncbi:MAG: type II secretion system protein [Candidatus Gastranaerophilales bacterium]